MASQSHSFYRKWRSQTFADVVGQDHVTRTLRNALEQGRIAHAYLLCGPRGVGKTSVARILAKAVNCTHKRAGEPCNECPMCRAITEGRALDVIEIDAASNRRIEEMRDLREKVNFAPAEADFKVYILDEAHMLTPEASNALLKTLEEPPKHTVFVLVTTEAHKIPETIISRCQRFNFRRISSQETISRLNLVCEREGLVVGPEALEVIARTATGSLRDAEGLLDQLVAYCGTEISGAQAREVLGLTGDEPVRQLADCLLGGDLAAGLGLVNDVAEAGADLGRFSEDLLGYLRGVLLLKGGAGGGTLRDVSGDTLDAMRGHAGRVSLDTLVKLIRIFSDLGQGPRSRTVPQLGLELALAEATVLQEREQRPAVMRPPLERPAVMRSPLERPPHVRPPVQHGTQQSERQTERPAIDRPAVERPAAERPEAVAGATSSAPRNAPAAASGERGKERPQTDGVEAPSQRPARAVEPATREALPQLLVELRRRWGEVLEVLGAMNKPLQALGRSTGPYEVRDGQIVIGCDSQFHQGRLGEMQHRLLVENAVAEVLAARVPLRFEVVPRQKRGQPPPATSDPLVKEVLSWGGKIRAIVTEEDGTGGRMPTDRPAKIDDEVNDEP